MIAHADHWRATGDRAFLDQSFEAILKAWRFTAGTDTDGNGLVENTSFGHGWVEGGDLYPPHEEIYQQGVWIEACRALAELAEVRGDRALAEEARARAERTRAAVEKTYWLEGRGFYAFATLRPRDEVEADRGPERARRQARLEVLARGGLADEDTVMPAVPMWWGELDDARAQSQLDHLGASALATDWGTRLLSEASELYDPLSYHHGSVWPLFTGWTAMAAYRYGRPQVGYQALAGQRRSPLADRAGLRDRAALGGLPRRLRPLLAPPGLVRGDGRDAARARPAGSRASRTAAARCASLPSSPPTGSTSRSARFPRRRAGRPDAGPDRRPGHDRPASGGRRTPGRGARSSRPPIRSTRASKRSR